MSSFLISPFGRSGLCGLPRPLCGTGVITSTSACRTVRHTLRCSTGGGCTLRLAFSQANLCSPPGLPLWFTGSCTTWAAPEFRNHGKAKTCVHRDKPGGGTPARQFRQSGPTHQCVEMLTKRNRFQTQTLTNRRINPSHCCAPRVC